MAAAQFGLRHFTRDEFQCTPVQSIAALFSQLQTDAQLDRVVIPIENSIEGPVVIAQDMMVQCGDFWVEEEFSIPIVNHLLVRPGTDWTKVTDVISHPQPLGQCRQFLTTRFQPAPMIHMADSTARAAELVSRGDPLRAGANPDYAAAIGNNSLATTYGLTIAAASIQDSDTNRTRFWSVGRSPSEPTGHDKTTIIFSTLKDRPGGLVDILSKFSERGINLSAISSRPTKTVLGDYLFFVDVDGHASVDPLKSALDSVKANASFFKWVGSYHVVKEQVC